MPQSSVIEGVIAGLEAKRLDMIEDALMTMPDAWRDEYREVLRVIEKLKEDGEPEVIAKHPAKPATKTDAPAPRKRAPRPAGFNSKERAVQNKEAVREFLSDHPESAPMDIARGAGVPRGSISQIMKKGAESGEYTVVEKEVDGRMRPHYSIAPTFIAPTFPGADSSPLPQEAEVE